jgi:hypothetical protein
MTCDGEDQMEERADLILRGQALTEDVTRLCLSAIAEAADAGALCTEHARMVAELISAGVISGIARQALPPMEGLQAMRQASSTVEQYMMQIEEQVDAA